MAGQALSVVQSQINTLTGFANSSLASAQSALSSLATLSFSQAYPPSFSFSLPNYSPVGVSPPGAIVVSTAPVISSITLPAGVNKPVIDTVTLGNLLSITLPNVPTVSFPSLDITAPVIDVQSPTAWSFNVGSNILISDDPLVQAALNRLTSNIVNGGTGLSPAVEAAIWARGREREEQQLEDSIDKATSLWAKRGFALPDGELANSLMILQTEYLNKQLDRSREIEIKQAELEQANLFKSLELAISLANTLIDMYVKYEELVFKGQEAMAKFANEYIDLQIKTYQSKVDAYRATAQVHEMMIRAELAKVEVYKAQLEGQKIINDINTQTVQIYAERLKATSILIERYRIEVDAKTKELETERLKIEANKLQMESWAKTADVAIAKYNGEVEMFKARSQFNIGYAELNAKQAEAQVRSSIAAASVSMQGYEAYQRSMDLKAQIMMEAARGVATAAGNMAAGAMAAASAHSSMSYDESVNIDGGEV